MKMTRKKMIKVVNKYKKQGYKLFGKDGIFAAIAKFTSKSENTIRSYYYADKKRPKAK